MIFPGCCTRTRQPGINYFTSSYFHLITHNVSLQVSGSSFTTSSNSQSASCGKVCLPRTAVGEIFDRDLFGRVSQDTLGELKALANIIQSSIEQIEGVVTANSYTFPSSDSTFTLETEAPRMHPVIQSAGSFITSAAAQLITLVRPAPFTLLDVMMQVGFIVPVTTTIPDSICQRSSTFPLH